MSRLLTIGHGDADQPELLGLLTEAGIGLVVDVRRFPGSRRNPHVAAAALEGWLPEAGIEYRWDPRLGGRRRLPPDAATVDAWWKVPAFRAYAAHTRTPEFGSGMEDLLGDVEADPRRGTAVMCSETLWWRCHRRLIADVLTSLGWEVVHIRDERHAEIHRLAEPARLVGGRLSYAGAASDRR